MLCEVGKCRMRRVLLVFGKKNILYRNAGLFGKLPTGKRRVFAAHKAFVFGLFAVAQKSDTGFFGGGEDLADDSKLLGGKAVERVKKDAFSGKKAEAA